MSEPQRDWSKWLPPAPLPDTGPKVFKSGQVWAGRGPEPDDKAAVIGWDHANHPNLLAGGGDGTASPADYRVKGKRWEHHAVLVQDVGQPEPTPPEVLYGPARIVAKLSEAELETVRRAGPIKASHVSIGKDGEMGVAYTRVVPNANGAPLDDPDPSAFEEDPNQPPEGQTRLLPGRYVVKLSHPFAGHDPGLVEVHVREDDATFCHDVACTMSHGPYWMHMGNKLMRRRQANPDAALVMRGRQHGKSQAMREVVFGKHPELLPGDFITLDWGGFKLIERLYYADHEDKEWWRVQATDDGWKKVPGADRLTAPPDWIGFGMLEVLGRVPGWRAGQRRRIRVSESYGGGTVEGIVAKDIDGVTLDGMPHVSIKLDGSDLDGARFSSRRSELSPSNAFVAASSRSRPVAMSLSTLFAVTSRTTGTAAYSAWSRTGASTGGTKRSPGRGTDMSTRTTRWAAPVTISHDLPVPDEPRDERQSSLRPRLPSDITRLSTVQLGALYGQFVAVAQYADYQLGLASIASTEAAHAHSICEAKEGLATSGANRDDRAFRIRLAPAVASSKQVALDAKAKATLLDALVKGYDRAIACLSREMSRRGIEQTWTRTT